MRTTVTLDPDTEALVRRAMKERGLGFKEALNDAIRRGAGDAGEPPYVHRSFNMGEPLISLDKATQVAAQLEDEEIVRKMELGK